MRVLACLCVLILLANCRDVTITGRQQINIVPDASVAAMADVQFEQMMEVARRYNAILTESDSPQAAEVLAMVHRVSGRIVAAAGLAQEHDWRVVVLKSRTVNAFALPGGKIVVFSGLLPVAKNEAGLAAVLGHEVGHVAAHHSAERLSQSLLIRTALRTADAVALAKNPAHRAQIDSALGLGAKYGLVLPFSREQESEADHLGLLYMAKAGYDPQEAIAIWQRMEATAGPGPWEFTSTHPSDATRRAQLQGWMPEAQAVYADRAQPLPAVGADAPVTRAARTETAAPAPVAVRPVLTDEFWYRVKVGSAPLPVTFRFHRQPCAGGTCIVMAGDNGSVRTVTDSFALVENRLADGAWARYSPPLQLAQWPLKVGDVWSERVTIETSAGRRIAAMIRSQVVAYEPVTVPSGTFLAHKIAQSMDGTHFQDLWFAADVKYFVKQVSYDTRGHTTVTELLDIKQDAPALPEE